MNKLNKTKCILISCAIIVSIIISTFDSNIISKANNSQNSPISQNMDSNYAKIKRDTSISVDSNGILQISRNNRENEIPMGKENSWTLFMYITGSNLESQYQYASTDIKEILNANYNIENIQNLNIIIQTGGSQDWQEDYISSEKIQRFIVNANSEQLTLVEEFDNASMGDPNTLYNFLKWGVKNYASEHMGVIFWNHGSGVSNGLCEDENYNNDSITVHELEYTFAKLNKKMSSKFELIGFDTCLSGSLEYANLLAPYAKYMIASADIEPGEGWHYTEPINYLLNNPDATGAEFGKIVCDTYADFIENMSVELQRKINYTLATYDLSKVDNACIETNYLTKYLYDKLLSKESEYWTLSNFRSTRLRYNMDNLDIGSILEYLDSFDNYDYNTTFYRNAMNELIIYSRISDKYLKRQALGISLYLPSSIITLKELNSYRNVCFSPYWLKYIEWVNIRAQAKTMENFQYYHWEKSPFFFEENFNFLNYDELNAIGYDFNSIMYNVLIQNKDYKDSTFPRKWYCNALNAKRKNPTDEILRVTPSRNLSLHNTIAIDSNYKDYIKNIYTNVYTQKDNMLICLGQNNKIDYNTDLGIATSNYDSTWFMLPDGQLLTTYITSSEDNCTIYSFPVMIDNVESSIRIEETLDYNGTPSYTLLGVWDTPSSKYRKDNFARGYLPLKIGTTITPIYDIYNTKHECYESEYGEEYTITSDFDFILGTLPKAKYSYTYEIEHIDGTYNYTKLYDLK